MPLGGLDLLASLVRNVSPWGSIAVLSPPLPLLPHFLCHLDTWKHLSLLCEGFPPSLLFHLILMDSSTQGKKSDLV